MPHSAGTVGLIHPESHFTDEKGRYLFALTRIEDSGVNWQFR